MMVINYLDWWVKRVEMREVGQMNMDWERHERIFNKILQWMAVEEIRKEEYLCL